MGSMSKGHRSQHKGTHNTTKMDKLNTKRNNKNNKLKHIEFKYKNKIS